MSGPHVFFDATRATCHVAYVAWEIGAFGRVGGEAEKRQVAYVAWEIAAFGRVGGEAEESGSICSVGNLGLWGEAEESGSTCSMGNLGLWEGRR